MAFNANMALEVDAATGNDANGGGFDAISGVPGTNYAWGGGQTTIAYTDMTSVGAGSTATSVARPFIAADVGNVINIVSGTNFVTGKFQILSVAAGTATFDRAITAGGAGALGTGTLGGSLLTIQQGMNDAFITTGARAADIRVYIKKGAYTGTVALVTASSIAAVNYASRVIGYNTTHDDDPTLASGNCPTYAVGSGAGVNGLTSSTSGFFFENIQFLGAVSSGTRGTTGILNTGLNTFWNVGVYGFSAEGYNQTSSTSSFMYGEVTGCVGTVASCVVLGTVAYCWLHLNTKSGLSLSTSGVAIGNLITNNSGATSDGITVAQYGTTIVGNTIYGNTRDGIRSTSNLMTNLSSLWTNNIIAKNAGVGINQTVATVSVNKLNHIDYNGFYGNGSNYTNVTAGVHDVAIGGSTSPFNSSDANLAAETAPDWGINAGVGAVWRASGISGPAGLTTTVGYRDIGAIQHADPASGGGGRIVGGYVAG